jgi:hypothetical protein
MKKIARTNGDEMRELTKAKHLDLLKTGNCG